MWPGGRCADRTDVAPLLTGMCHEAVLRCRRKDTRPDVVETGNGSLEQTRRNGVVAVRLSIDEPSDSPLEVMYGSGTPDLELNQSDGRAATFEVEFERYGPGLWR